MKYKLLITLTVFILTYIITVHLTFDQATYNECQFYLNEANYYENRANYYEETLYKLWNIHLEVLNKGGN